MLAPKRILRLLPHHRCVHNHYGCGPLKLLFFGRDDFSCVVFKEILKAQDVWANIDVVTTPDDRVGRRHSEISRSPLGILAKDFGVPCHFIPKELEGMTPWLPPAPFNERALNHVIISASYGRAITNDVLSLFDHRLNVHPSLIPKYRGPSPIQTAIANDDVETGVSVINMEDVSQGFDTGDVHAIEKVKIPPRASYNTLAPILAQKGGELLVEVLRRLSKGIFTKYPQDHSQATKTRMIRAKAGDVNWTDDAQRIDRLHRAYGHQRPLVTTFMPNSQKKEPPRRLILSGVFVAEFDPPTSLEQPGECTFLPELKALLVLCGNGTALVVQSVKREGKGFIAAGEWWNGIRDERIRLGR